VAAAVHATLHVGRACFILLYSARCEHRLHTLQVGFKAMAYVMLHGEATLDLLEIAPRELQFRQVPGLAGDFLQLQGKFMLVSDEPQPQVGHSSK
jgi:hypothetical protein